jgi:hypothetical protein
MKEIWLEQAITDFKNSSQDVEEYMELFYVFHKCIRPDSGLLWSQIKEIVNKVINDVR